MIGNRIAQRIDLRVLKLRVLVAEPNGLIQKSVISILGIVVMGSVGDERVDCLALGSGRVEVHQRFVQPAWLNHHLHTVCVHVLERT